MEHANTQNTLPQAAATLESPTGIQASATAPSKRPPISEDDVLRLVVLRNELGEIQERLCGTAEFVLRRLDESGEYEVKIGPHVVQLDRESAGGVRSISLRVNGGEVWRREIRPRFGGRF